MRGLFVTATDTGVGKTVLTAAIVLALRARGLQAGVAKPVQSGALAADPEGDAMVLRRWTGVGDDVDVVAPYCFAAPLAPLIAARQEGRRLVLEDVVARVRAVGDRHDAVLVEGAGGLLTPVGEDWTIADLAASLRLPLLVVARAGLGTVNHATLTVHVARGLGLDLAGVVLNGSPDGSTPANAAMIEQFAGVPVLGQTPQLDGELTAGRLRALVEDHLAVDALVDAVRGRAPG